MGLKEENFQKPLSINTIRRAICRCQLKLYHAKRKPYVNMVQKRRRVLWDKAHLKWTVSKWKSVLWSDESKFDILVGNHGRRVLRAKEEGDLPACSHRSVQKHLWWYGDASLNEGYVKYDHKLFSSWKPISGKNGTKFQLQKLITSMPRRLQTILKRRADAL